MKELVKHLWRENPEQIAVQSIKNCHIEGLHSIMFIDTPGKRIRLFVTDDHHTMWKNDPTSTKSMTIGFHTHHCNISLLVVKGLIKNWVVKESNMGKLQLHAYKYNSQIIMGEIGFVKLPYTKMFKTVSNNILQVGATVSAFMEADDIHTVAAQNGESAAWFVFEGLEDSEYKPITYSNDPELHKSNYDSLYLPMTVTECEQKLKLAGLL